jgi:hypothetical protein
MWWSEFLAADPEVSGSIPGPTMIFLSQMRRNENQTVSTIFSYYFNVLVKREEKGTRKKR